MVRHRLWRHLFCRRHRRASLGPARRRLWAQADAGARRDRHDHRHLTDGHGDDRVAAGGTAARRRAGRRLCLGLDGAGGRADAKRSVSMGARHTIGRHHGRQSGGSADRRGFAAADRHPRHVPVCRGCHLLRLSCHAAPDPRGKITDAKTGGQRRRRVAFVTRQGARCSPCCLPACC